MKLTLLLIIALVFSGCSTSSDESPKRLAEQASELTSPTSDSAELATALELLDEAIALQGEYLPARKQRVSLLVRLNRLDEAAREAEEIAELSGSPQDYFYYCMAREASEPGYDGQQECYKNAARHYEKDHEGPARDVNYVLALKLADLERFDAAAERFLSSLEADASRALFEPLLMESGRDVIISDLFYPPAISTRPARP